jgi:uncharacterized RDD family membrane protein YckC
MGKTTMEKNNELSLEGLELASFSERVVAFVLDILLAAGGYAISHMVIFRADSVIGSPHAAEWTVLWTFLFVLYQTYFSSEGRTSLGKLLLGLAVVDEQGQPLAIGQAGLRSISYLLSSILDLGFLWSLFNPHRQCWHDMVVASVVVRQERRSEASHALVRVAAAACMALIGGLWYWNHVAEPRYTQIMNVAYANVGMAELKQLQRIYHLKHHRYANDISQLAPLSPEPDQFAQNMSNLFDHKAGVEIKADRDSYTVTARAMDDNRTLVALNGP